MVFDQKQVTNQAAGGKPGKPGVDDNPGKGGGKGRTKMSVCMLQEGRVKHQILPAHAALKMINEGKAVAAPNGESDCEVLDDSLQEDES